MRKNKKRIDPRYFLNETTRRDLNENYSSSGGKEQLGKAIFMVLRDYRSSEQNPLSLSALLDSGSGAVLRYLKEFGLDERGIKDAMSYRRHYMAPGAMVPVPGGDGGQYVELKQATVPEGFPAAGERGVYMVDAQDTLS